ncbi:MAG: DUF427 domain-containing protein [Pseudomonadota bacterium]
MNIAARDMKHAYRIDIQPLSGTVTAFHGDVVVAQTDQAKVMFETRLPPTVYFPKEDVQAEIIGDSELQTFCPFKGTASYCDLRVDGQIFKDAIWCYDDPLPESEGIAGYVGFMPNVVTELDTGDNVLPEPADGNLTGPLVDWLLREAPAIQTPEELTRELALNFIAQGISVSRISIMIWSLHPLIIGRNFVWNKASDEVNSYAPSWEIHDHPAFANSPLRHVASGLGGVRHRLVGNSDQGDFPILQDLRKKGATDYVAMPLPFSDGRKNVLTLTCDHPVGFTTENLGLVFECTPIISRLFEVFTLKDNAQSLLETYVGKRTGARVLGGDIRRGDGDEIDAAIMFCDLRGSTRLEEELGRREYIDLLNQFFETASTMVQDNGGEVLKFIGDAVLAVFPAERDGSRARHNALKTAREIVGHLGADRAGPETLAMECAIGLAYGRVMYGNVGSRERLDFTVIGQAANIAARLGDFGKTCGHSIVTTSDFQTQDTQLLSLGDVALHNVSRPVSAYSGDDTPEPFLQLDPAAT